ncbi:hypothetical protein JCM10450v2_007990 [Rhodotorula kratochvilovae]
MHLSTLLPIALLATSALAAPSTGDSLPALERRLASAESEAAKAGRLVKRAQSYGNSADAKHKREVFAGREKRWEEEADDLKTLVKRERMAYAAVKSSVAAASASSASSAAAAAAATPTSRVVRQPYASLKSSLAVESSSATRTTTTTTQPAATTTTRPAATSTATTAPATTSTAAALPSGVSSKKGVGYNDASLTNNLAISWAYNWGQIPEGKLNPGVEYVPMLWSDNAGDWTTNAQKAIDAGSTHLLGFNEPDLVGQADMTIPEAVAGWRKYMSPFFGKAKLVSPAVTNGGYPLGRDYLGFFFGNCTQCLEETEAIALHWYDAAWNVGYFKNYLTEAYQRFNKPIWVTEFAGSGSVAEQQQFFKTVLPWMEEQSGDFVGTYVNADGSLTALGKTYSETV